MSSNHSYYVYAAYVDDVLRYVGKGKGNRYLHCNSGKSSCYKLNEDHFQGRDIVVIKVFENLDNKTATEYETYILNELKDAGLYNIQIGKAPDSKRKENVRLWAQHYLTWFDFSSPGERVHLTEVKRILLDASEDRPFYHDALVDHRRIMPLLGFIKEKHEGKHYWTRCYQPSSEEVLNAILYYYDKVKNRLVFDETNVKSLLNVYAECA